MKRSWGIRAGLALLLAGLCLGLWMGLGPGLGGPDPQEVDGERILATVELLSDETVFAHRNVSLPGNREAARYIASQFQAYGLAEHPEAPDYLQVYDGEKANVIGLVPGSDPVLSRETIIIGGHFDTKAIFVNNRLVHEPGALDNASGTATVMEIARVMADAQPRRTLIFVAFNEEEAGFFGSEWLAAHPLDGVDPVAMVNLDMVGSAADNPLYVCTIGYGDAPYPLQEAFLESARVLGIRTATGAVGRTDHRSFASRGIPAVDLYCWDNRYYHTVADTPEKLSPQRLQEAGMLVVRWLREAAY